MPLTVITLTKVKENLRGDLTKWMQEISTGVYVGNFNSKVRENLWLRIIENIGDGKATMTYASRNEIGYRFKCHNTDRTYIDSDGIPLVLISKDSKTLGKKPRHGFSKQAKMQKAKRYKEKRKEIEYIVLDLETSGLDPYKDRIIEIGAIRVKGDERREFNEIIKQDIKLSKKVKSLTKLDQKDIDQGEDEKEVLKAFKNFIGGLPIVAYNANFDINFLNESFDRNFGERLDNKAYDILKYVKREKLFLQDYRLQTVIRDYGIDEEVPHRALEDARLILKLSSKVKGFIEKLK